MTLREPGQTTGYSAVASALNGHKVVRRVLSSSIDLVLELELVALAELAEARTLDRADMDEGIGFAIIARDETEALHRVEELHGAGGFFAGALTLRRSRASTRTCAAATLLDRNHIADDLQVRRGNLPAAIDQVEGEFLTLGQAFQPRPLHLADVDEHVLAAFVALNEAKAFLRIEELDLALAGAARLCGHPA